MKVSARLSMQRLNHVTRGNGLQEPLMAGARNKPIV
jgi:hypothetical protein